MTSLRLIGKKYVRYTKNLMYYHDETKHVSKCLLVLTIDFFKYYFEKVEFVPLHQKQIFNNYEK